MNDLEIPRKGVDKGGQGKETGTCLHKHLLDGLHVLWVMVSSDLFSL